jgi:hypothetical protein
MRMKKKSTAGNMRQKGRKEKESGCCNTTLMTMMMKEGIIGKGDWRLEERGRNGETILNRRSF